MGGRASSVVLVATEGAVMVAAVMEAAPVKVGRAAGMEAEATEAERVAGAVGNGMAV